MKKWFRNLNIFGVTVLVLLAFTMVAVGQTPQTDPVSQEAAKLEKELKLDESQTPEVRVILEKANKKALEDRETFKTDALQLISAARERRKTVGDQISKLLKPEQQEIFQDSRQMSRLDREFFMLTEGLLLDDDQAFTVEGVLIDYYNRLEEIMPHGAMQRGSGGRDGGGGRGMGRSGGGARGMGMMAGGRGFMGQFQNKKNSKIRKVLSKDQKALFSQILKDQKKKMKERRKQMKERMKKNKY
ncbi:MAG: hypothetical protein GY940_30840 [bacterium]|nr:hypothetical protein [bacterium]